MTMACDTPDPAADLVALIRERGRWPSVAQPLLAALDEERWRNEGFPSPTAWLDRLAALGGRSTTYLSRCVSAARFLTQLKKEHPNVSVSQIWSRSLSDIEEFRRKVGDDQNLLLKRLPELTSGKLTSYGLRLENKHQGMRTRKAERGSLEKSVLDGLSQLIREMGYPPDSEIFVEPRTPVGRPDIVIVDSETGATAIIEVKSNLSRRLQDEMVQQLLAYSSLGHEVWVILPSDSEVPVKTIIDNLKKAAVKHVGALLLNPAHNDVVRLWRPERKAADSESRSTFKRLVRASERAGG